MQPVDWTTWTPNVRATLMFVRRGDALLLIRKKTGLGKGKINAPGGKLEPGETPAEAAIREIEEEVGLVTTDLRHAGSLSFAFADGLHMHVEVFTTWTFSGEPISTPEADPIWTAIADLPYDEMWPDDRVWLPELLRGNRFDFRARYDGEAMLDYEIDVEGV